MTTAAEVLTGLSEATTLIGALVPGAGLVTSWLGPLFAKGAEMARAGLTPQHITRIDVAALKRLVAESDASLDARAEAHDAEKHRRGFAYDSGGERAARPAQNAFELRNAEECGPYVDPATGAVSSEPIPAEAHDAPPSTEPAPSVYPEDGT